ncbi:MAG TPA: hypothetical protein VD966_03145 [Pyrinomonadaceae bacterium]|nr:hypothetical protein [Pyrinomonadaceae bacterium]
MRIHRQAAITGCFIICISLLIASCGNKRAAHVSIGPATAMPVARTLPPLPVRPLSAELRAMRERTMRVASDLRELAFTGEVGMAELSGWEYGTRASEMAQVLGGDELRALSRLASAGGMLPEGTDLASLAASFTALSAGATYSPLDKQILLMDKFKSDSLLTHEFVHALQDQHFDLLRLLSIRPYNFDRTEAVFAVIEGDAVNVQRRAEEGDGYARRPLEEIKRQEGARFDEYREEVKSLFPPLLTETFIFRYRDGAHFVEAVRRGRGGRGVNELFQRPPASSEQVLHPEKYQADEAPREVRLDEQAFATSGWRSVASTPLGEIGVRGLLMAGVSEREAARAAAGWGGDRAYLFERAGAAPLFVWKTAWDKQEDAVEFFRAYKALLGRGGKQTNDALAGGGEAQVVWGRGGRLTLARRDGDAVIIIRGAEADLPVALELARR